MYVVCVVSAEISKLLFPCASAQSDKHLRHMLLSRASPHSDESYLQIDEFELLRYPVRQKLHVSMFLFLFNETSIDHFEFPVRNVSNETRKC